MYESKRIERTCRQVAWILSSKRHKNNAASLYNVRYKECMRMSKQTVRMCASRKAGKQTWKLEECLELMKKKVSKQKTRKWRIMLTRKRTISGKNGCNYKCEKSRRQYRKKQTGKWERLQAIAGMLSFFQQSTPSSRKMEGMLASKEAEKKEKMLHNFLHWRKQEMRQTKCKEPSK